MKALVARGMMLVGVLLPGVLQAQQVYSPRPGGGGPGLPPHVRAQLWPERELTPTEAELKKHVGTMTDTLVRFDATVALLERHRASGASNALIRSTARTLGSDCARAGRAATPVDSFARTLTTNNARWGDAAVREYRQSLVTLRREMESCAAAVNTLTTGNGEIPVERVTALANRAAEAVRGYQRAEYGLLRTLRMDTTPEPKGRNRGR